MGHKTIEEKIADSLEALSDRKEAYVVFFECGYTKVVRADQADRYSPAQLHFHYATTILESTIEELEIENEHLIRENGRLKGELCKIRGALGCELFCPHSSDCEQSQ